MRLGHGLASLIWTAVLVIAVQFIAGSAFAHTGHSHHHPTASQSSVAHQSNSISMLQALQKDDANLSATPSNRDDRPVPTQSGGCAGGCCGNGIGCCGAMIETVSGSLPDFRVRTAPIWLAFHRGSGADPASLRRPPRTLA
jgi:hypothetical protein